MTKSSKGYCGLCGTKRCMKCGKCPNVDCEKYVSCLFSADRIALLAGAT